ncbi:MAG: TIR domain-containing protein [Intrasporangiaceae bacterium]|nr:TIR domain-containing protein [Intrasporangiaceae bacterium]
MTHDVFVCHSSKDRTIANAIVATLEAHGIRCWVAPRDVIPGLEYAESIIEAIGRSTLTVLVFSAHANSSPHVRRELERTASHGIPILPFRVEDVVPAPSVEYFISDAHWLDAMTPPMEQHLDHLVGTVRLLLDRQAALTPTTSVGAEHPSAGVRSGSTDRPPTASSAPTRPRPGWLIPAVIAAAIVAIALIVGVMTLLGDGDGGGTPTQAAPTLSPTDSTSDDAPSEATDQDDDAALEPQNTFIDGFDVAVRQGWTWVDEDPDGWRVADGWLEIDAVASPPIVNLLVREVPESPLVVLSTQLRFRPTANYQFAGIVLAGDDPENDRIQFGRAFCDEEWCVGDGLYLDVMEDGRLVELRDGVALDGAEDIYLGLEVGEDGVTATYSYDGGEDWFVLDTAPFDASYTRIGLVAHQAETSVTAAFEYVVLAEYR